MAKEGVHVNPSNTGVPVLPGTHGQRLPWEPSMRYDVGASTSHLIPEVCAALEAFCLCHTGSGAKASWSKQTARYGKFSVPFKAVLFTSLP